MLLKEASVPFEDERYCYVVVTREKVASGARILAPPLEAKPGLTFKLCDETGLAGSVRGGARQGRISPRAQTRLGRLF